MGPGFPLEAVWKLNHNCENWQQQCALSFGEYICDKEGGKNQGQAASSECFELPYTQADMDFSSNRAG